MAVILGDVNRVSTDARQEIEGIERRARLRDRSKLAFGTQARLEIALAVLEHGGHVTNETLRRLLGLPQSTVHMELRDLEALGVIVRVPQTTGRTVYYRPVPHPFWELCRNLADPAVR